MANLAARRNSSTMATDSTLEETDAPPDEGREETGPSPPRPPRPGKRSKGSGRVPIPLPQSRPSLEAVESSSYGSAPGVDIDEPIEPEYLSPSSRGKPASLPEESFADLDVDLADRAPPAPVTPRRVVARGPFPAGELTPPRGTPLRFASDDEESLSEPEPTLVGKVSENLLELSSASDENTRAFTAPRELIELARRKREERQQSASEELGGSTARPFGGAGDAEPITAAAPAVPVGAAAAELTPDAAPVVPREPGSEPYGASSARVPSVAPDSGPEIEIDPASELSPSARRAVLASTGRHELISQPAELAKKPALRAWLLWVGLLVVVGMVIARWRDLAALFH